MAFFFSKRKVRPVEGEAAGELNVVPYLDILMNLILFILLSLTGLATFGVVNASAQSSPTPGPVVATDEALRLTVAVSARGFFVASWEGVGGTDGMPNVPALADGSPDYGGLTGKLVEVKRAFPHATKLVLAAEADVPFEVLVATMDAAREVPGQGLLFPDVTLGAF